MDRRGEDLELLYEKCDWPAEFLRDPASWLEADKMENLLRQIDLDYGRDLRGEETLIEAVGHQCKDMRAWGVLDSVLRMVQTPKDLYAQPERLLSYFVSPAPPVAEVRRGPDSVSFVLPVSEMQFPLVTSYLRAALEALPTYINKPMATVKWDNSRVTISWSDQQASLFGEAQNTELSLHPELVRNILVNLEDSQKQVEAIKKELIEKDQEIAELKRQLQSQPVATEAAGSSQVALAEPPLDLSQLASGLNQDITEPVSRVLNELYRLGDYMARGQQLITLLIGQGRATPQVQEAMRRVDWSFVASEGPQVVKRAVQGLQQVQEVVRDIHLVADTDAGRDVTVNEGARVPTDLNELVSRAIESVKGHAPSGIQIDGHLLLDRQVSVYPTRIEQAVVNLLNNAVGSLAPGGVVRVVTRPRGHRAEIEITDTGRGIESAKQATNSDRATETLFAAPINQTNQKTGAAAPANGFGLSVARSIVKMHDGSLMISSEPGRGSTILVDLPLTN